MTLATHAVTGALIGAVGSENLAFAAGAGFLSHFVFDTIPHWDYKLGAATEDKNNPLNNTMNVGSKAFIVDLAKIGLDFLLGMVIVAFLVYSKPTQVIIGAFVGALFAVIPDPLQFVYWKFKPLFMQPLQRFHVYMHADTRLNDRPVIGIGSQLGIIIITAVVFWLLM
jgi:uncharacterized protein (DUF2062 family)